MAIKAIYENKDDIPENVADLYTERDGKWELTEVEGVKTEADVSRVQDALRKEREDHDASKQRLKQVEVEKQSVADEIEVLKNSGAGKDGEGDKELQLKYKRLEREKQEADEQLKSTGEELNALKSSVQRNRVKDSLRAAAKGIIREDAIDDVVDKVQENFTLSDGEPLTKDAGDGKVGMSPKDFLTDYASSREYLAPTSRSGGAKGGQAAAGINGEQPMSTKDFIDEILS